MAAGGKGTLDTSPTLIEQQDWINGVLIYEGWALPGTATSTAGWKIRKRLYSSTGTPSGKAFAGGAATFVNVWNNRASLSYS